MLLYVSKRLMFKLKIILLFLLITILVFFSLFNFTKPTRPKFFEMEDFEVNQKNSIRQRLIGPFHIRNFVPTLKNRAIKKFLCIFVDYDVQQKSLARNLRIWNGPISPKMLQNLYINETSGEDPDPTVRERRNKIREMTLHAWNNYKSYAWGMNQLRPISKKSDNAVFGPFNLGETIVDSLDTLFIMGLEKEYLEGREWVAKEFTLKDNRVSLSVFETTIRFIGGFLTMYAFTGDSMYKEKAKEVADKLLPAFKTNTGIPRSFVDAETGESYGDQSILAEIGTLHLEFAYLSDLTGDPIYRKHVLNIRNVLKDIPKPDGLYRNHVDTRTGQYQQGVVSLGGMGDSFYEYLLKAWIQSGKTHTVARQMYDDAMEAVVNKLVHISKSGLMYLADMTYGALDHTMGHLACFTGGMFALGAATKLDHSSKKYMEIGKELTNTCHESYIRTPTHLGPEFFGFNEEIEAMSSDRHRKIYILRPETIESYFILWRLTHEQKYRDWAWDAAMAIEKYCRVPGGFSGLDDVYVKDPKKNDVQESFFIAEVLKYLYLIFSDDSLLPLDEWVFNTEAHPLPMKGSPMY